MSSTTTPLEAMFEMQRQSIEHGQQLFEQSLELQQNALETALHNGIATQRSAQRQGTELTRQVTNAQYDAVEETVDDGELREAIDHQFAESAQRTQKLLNAQFEHGTDLFQQLLRAQFDALESTVDGGEFDARSSIDQQFEEFDQAQEDAWNEFEAVFLETVDDLSDQQKVLLAESVDSFLDAQRETAQRTVEGVRGAQEMAETVQQESQDVVETVQRETEDVAAEAAEATVDEVTEGGDVSERMAVETTDAIENAVEAGADATQRNLQTLEGVGATYAARLASIEIDTVEDLADAQATVIAEAAEISEEQADAWIEAAQSQE
ncbi:helix-hairpin-helix domain-containing protein [Natronoglomus mannanivorans]|uniref:Helix-hairpin-helix domain-containing protein n=1 Tax=Natronoglomus mannanivorans TaxID=2979990 RepID=A0AAP3E2V9_9EURY|nr:helix-hairpin-helix domain-containing protein [Halobacteria archaeon AArc-xg1-1]